MISFSTWLVWVLRKASYRWHTRYKAMRAAKVDGQPNTYKCATCKKDYKKIGRKRTITLDHIVPVKDPNKPNAFQDDLATCQCGVCGTVRRMFPATPEGWQVLCKKCHDKKTKGETKVRVKARKQKKQENSNG